MAPGCCEPGVAPGGGCCAPKKPSAKEQFLALCKSLGPEENKQFMVWLAKEVGERQRSRGQKYIEHDFNVGYRA